ncbi:hypothetical protein Tco_1387953 [Tanacetum coccineum]
MTTLQFVDTHNLVAFLAKPAESEGFEQIVDFLNAHTIKYALTVNPTIYTSCIEQFWDTVKEGTDCLPNATIFKELTRMGYEKLLQKLTFYKAFFSPQWNFLIRTILQCLSAKTTAWNKFSSTMASAIIFLAKNQKFNFSKYIFQSMVKNLDNAGKFLIYPRFVQVFLDKQLEGMQSHNRINVTPSYTKKIFGNMNRVGKGFSGRETPLFPTMMVQNQAEMGEGSAILTDPHHAPQKKQRSRRPKRKDTEVPQPSGPTTNVANEAVFEDRDDSLKRAATTATSLDAEQDRVIDLENTKTAQTQEITSLKLRVKKLEKKGGSRTHKLKRLYKERKIDDIDKDADITLVDETRGRYGDDIMFDVSDFACEEVFVAEQGVFDKDVNSSVDEVTLAQALAALKSAKAKIQDKGKAKMIEPEPVKKLSKKDQLKLDEEVAQRLQAEFDEQERIEREKTKANIALKETWDDIQAKIEADCLLAERLQAREQEELTIEEKAILFQQLLEKRRKHFATKRAEEKRNIPPTKAQQRSIMCTYLKNMEGWKPKDLKSKSFANIQELFDKAMKRVNTFVDYRNELVEGSSKKAEAEITQESSSKGAGDELKQESIKKQKVDEDKEIAELKSLMEVIPDKEKVAVDAIPLATKPPSIVDWKIHK